jgi:DNA ligase 4
VFDILLLNDKLLVNYPLSERKKALQKIITPSQGCVEILAYQLANTEEEIDKKLIQVIEESSEGLVIKSPISPYRVSDRLDSWIKVKPDYMEELGENLDLCVIGGFYGQGKRGNSIAAFLCGLRANDPDHPMKFWSFCKVGGGFSANDFAEIRHATESKWHTWDPKRPPSEYIEVSDESRKEIPDLWIKPSDSLVFEVKGSQIITSISFRTKQTVRFPRFKKIREDKNWEQSLSLEEFSKLQAELVTASKVPQKFDPEIKRSPNRTRTKRLKLLNDNSEVLAKHKDVISSLFRGKTFYVVADVVDPKRISKFDLEKIIKENGGTLAQNTKDGDAIVIADRSKIFECTSDF